MNISRAPLRISFFGGGTDYPEYFRQESGAVLGTAIDKYSYVTASPFPSELFDYSVRVSYRKVELVKDVSDIEHAVYRECLRFCGLTCDVELHAVADLPAFTGLGSSSSFTVALLHALHAFKRETVSSLQLAYEAIHIERQVLGEAVGCQDQVIAAVGGFNLIEFRAEDDVLISPLAIHSARLQELEASMLLIFTGVKRRAGDIAAAQLHRLALNMRLLKRMRTLVDEGASVLLGHGPLSSFGTLLDAGWRAKRELDVGISTDAIDRMYAIARQHGAWGGKLLGAGGGGFLLLVAPPERHSELCRALLPQQALRVKIGGCGSQIVFESDAGAGALSLGNWAASR
jgi:D-glycero-alpha-D-manno-heptose-7-phosphate kinase